MEKPHERHLVLEELLFNYLSVLPDENEDHSDNAWVPVWCEISYKNIRTRRSLITNKRKIIPLRLTFHCLPYKVGIEAICYG